MISHGSDDNAHITQMDTSLPMDICSLSFSSVFLRDFSKREDLSFHSSISSFWSFWSLGIFFTILLEKIKEMKQLTSEI